MNPKIILFLSVFFLGFQSITGQEKATKLSARPPVQGKSFSAIIKTSGQKMGTVLEGLKFSTTRAEVSRILKEFKSLQSHPDYQEKKWDLIGDSMGTIFLTPVGTLSLIWPLFLIGLFFWFIGKFANVFLEPVNKLISEN